ncbi:HepT-like ribonuclease domain-containing protein [Enterovirga aerilata]|uniref:DUF86 domain-containing protein n=1 Tax=Enterovirga aerilata TaxID=2730920 RepID=A0A849I4X8_9HYPH|nr:HepT-like ribonuclease domain-containing protein [Enterovirga sp. DB1703]NNM71170.1 DUF86 domain-containing protein [Enterovirga sp. DB1703]
MLDARQHAFGAVTAVSDLGWDDVWNHRATRNSLLFDLIVVGEALGSVSPAVQGLAPDVPWSAIRGMRNRLVHEYWLCDEFILACAVSEDLPKLIRALDALLQLLVDRS